MTDFQLSNVSFNLSPASAVLLKITKYVVHLVTLRKQPSICGSGGAYDKEVAQADEGQQCLFKKQLPLLTVVSTSVLIFNPDLPGIQIHCL